MSPKAKNARHVKANQGVRSCESHFEGGSARICEKAKAALSDS